MISLIFKFFFTLIWFIKRARQKKFEKIFLISVGNLSFGGTGKTSFVIDLASRLREKGKKVAIICRAYKSSVENRSAFLAQIDNNVQEIGDEATLYLSLLKECDIILGKDKEASIKKAIDRGNDIAIIDDGFQSSNIYKNYSILLFNNNHSYYYLRGFRFLRFFSDINLFLDDDKEDKSYSFIKEGFYTQENKKILISRDRIIAFAGLGDNKRFFNDLSSFNIIKTISYKDHHFYSLKDINYLKQLSEDLKTDFIVCTLKDFVKIKNYVKNSKAFIYYRNSLKFKNNIIEKIIQDIIGK